jgi:hypothetical protein
MIPRTYAQRKFLDSEEAAQIKQTLKHMEKNDDYNTTSTYIANGLRYPGNNISFTDKHMRYLSEHPKLNPKHYLSNLRLITRKR